MIEIQVEAPFQAEVEVRRIRLAAEAALKGHKRGTRASLTILVGSNERIQGLNREYMGVDAPTDVLSFPADFEDPESGRAYLGDIVIGFPRAKGQAEAGGHAVMEELQLLVVHGTLHLLGYDHASEEGKEAMWQAQDRALVSLGVKARPHD